MKGGDRPRREINTKRKHPSEYTGSFAQLCPKYGREPRATSDSCSLVGQHCQAQAIVVARLCVADFRLRLLQLCLT